MENMTIEQALSQKENKSLRALVRYLCDESDNGASAKYLSSVSEMCVCMEKVHSDTHGNGSVEIRFEREDDLAVKLKLFRPDIIETLAFVDFEDGTRCHVESYNGSIGVGSNLNDSEKSEIATNDFMRAKDFEKCCDVAFDLENLVLGVVREPDDVSRLSWVIEWEDRTKNPLPWEKGKRYRIIVPFPDNNKSE